MFLLVSPSGLTWSARHAGSNASSPTEPRLFHVHAVNRGNLGDMLSSPLKSFPELKAKVHAVVDIGQSATYSIAKYRITRLDYVIVGGGGLLNCRGTWNDNLRALCRAARCIIWSVGRNTHEGTRLAHKIDTKELHNMSIVFRTRDKTELPSNRTLLDTTCLHPAFDSPCPSGARGHGSYLHTGSFTAQMRAQHQAAEPGAILYNNASSLDNVKVFMCRFKRVTTTSYHGLLWAHYLGRQVDVVGWSSKFGLLPFTLGVDSGPEVLARCRAENRAFYSEHIAPLVRAGLSRKPARTPDLPADLSWHLHAIVNDTTDENVGVWKPGPPLLEPNQAGPWPSRIPKHIHLACRSRATLEQNPAKVLPAWRALHPGFHVTVHEDDDMRAFLHAAYGAAATDVWDGIPHWAGPIKSDLWRAAFLFRHGGVYTDDDNEPLLPLNHAVAETDTFLTSNADRRLGSFNPHLIVAVPGHPVLNETFHRILASLRASVLGAERLELPQLDPRLTYPTHKGNASLWYWNWSIGVHMYETFDRLFAPLRQCPSEGKFAARIGWTWRPVHAPRVCGLRPGAGGTLGAGVRLLKESTLTIRDISRPITLISDEDRRVLLFNHYSGWQRCEGCGHIGIRAKISLESKRWRRKLCAAECL